MKRMLIILVCINLIVSLFPTSVNAETPTNSESVAITYFEDGSYCITTITVVQHILDRATITGTKGLSHILCKVYNVVQSRAKYE